MFTLPIYNTEGKEVETIKLDEKVFDGTVHLPALHQSVVTYRANQRKGLASTKTRGEVSGGGVKPWRQKGTGRARVGSIRSPLWRGGGVVFGPHPRDFSHVLPKRIKNLALKSSLNAKVKENNLIILDELKIKTPKTKEADKIFSNKLFENAHLLLLLDKMGRNERLALQNLESLRFNLAQNACAYDVLSCKKLVITREGLIQLIKRLKSR